MMKKAEMHNHLNMQKNCTKQVLSEKLDIVLVEACYLRALTGALCSVNERMIQI